MKLVTMSPKGLIQKFEHIEDTVYALEVGYNLCYALYWGTTGEIYNVIATLPAAGLIDPDLNYPKD